MLVEQRGDPVLQRNRELVNGPLTLDYLMQRAAEGWKIAAVEWIREVDGMPADPPSSVDAPYGLRISADGLQLEQNPLERTVLLLILDNIVREKRITEIARELNAHGLSTRRGKAWSPSDVFELLPTLIEAGPTLLKSNEWQSMRSRPALPRQ
jgi:hypothetical protein